MTGQSKKGGAKGKGKNKGGGGGGGGAPGGGAPGGESAPPPDRSGAIPGDPAYAAAAIAKVRAVWEEMEEDARAELLALPLADLEAAAAAAAAREEAEAGAAAALLGGASPSRASSVLATGGSSSSAGGSDDGGGASEAALAAAPPSSTGPSAPATPSRPGLTPAAAFIDTYDGDAAGALRALKEGIARLQAARAKAKAKEGGGGGEGGGEGSAPAPASASPPSSSSSPPTPLPSYKLWRWPATGAEFPDASAFRAYVVAELVPARLRGYLPPPDEAVPPGGLPPGSPPPKRTPETPAETALRTRMATLLARIQAATGGTGPLPSEAAAYEQRTADPRATAVVGLAAPLIEPPAPATASVPAGVDINAAIAADVLTCLEAEHEFVYAPIAGPVARFVCEALPPARRLSSPPDLVPDDLTRLDPDDALRVHEWVVERVDALAAKVKPDEAEQEEAAAKAARRAARGAAGGAAGGSEGGSDGEEEDDDEGLGDVDLFTLDDGGARLIVTPAWLRHLATRILGEDGASPRTAKPGEDPARVGLTLEWVFGSIVSTAEKARDAAKRGLGSWVPSPDATLARLLAALAEQEALDARLAEGRALLSEMLAGRKAAAELAEGGADLRTLVTHDAAGRELPKGAPAPPPLPASLPDAVCRAMLGREEMLTRAKLRVLVAKRANLEKRVRRARTAARSAEPEFE